MQFALVVDRTGQMGASLGALAKASGALDAFVAAPGHRLAVIQWGDGPARVSVPFTRAVGAVPRAIRGLRAGPSNDLDKDLYGALDAARHLDWAAGSRKSLLVLTATTWHTGPRHRDVAGWTDAAGVEVNLVDPSAHP